MESITESLINHRHIEPPSEGLLLCKYSEPTFLHNREKSKANMREGSERDSEQKSGNAEAFQSINRSNQRLKALKLNSKFFFFVSLFLFSCPKKEKVNKEQTISKVLSDKLKRQVRGDCATRKAAFTLAEVLITLGIIGVVAAMTLPTLIANHQQKVTVTKLKKVYSIMNQAYLRALEDNGPLSSWGLEKSEFEEDPETGEEVTGDQSKKQALLFWSKFKPYFQALKICTDINANQCEEYSYYTLQGTPGQAVTLAPRIILNDGVTLQGGWIEDPNCKKNFTCGDFSVDINGASPPNAVGRDIFYFWIYNDRLTPMGTADTSRPNYRFENLCLRNGSDKSNGYACTAWVIFNENMDYLKCDGLSWSGKHKCK